MTKNSNANTGEEEEEENTFRVQSIFLMVPISPKVLQPPSKKKAKVVRKADSYNFLRFI